MNYIALLLISTALSQEVKIPQSVAVAVGRLAAIEMSHDGDDFRYDVPSEMDAFREYSDEPNVIRLRVIAYTPGTFRITAVSTKTVSGKARLSPFVSCLVVVGSPGPGPIPPRPTPPIIPPEPDPIPVPPDPTPAGPRTVIILRESAEDTTALARLITNLQAGPGRDYLKSKGHACFVLDDDATDASDRPSPLVEGWKKALNLPFPVVAILDSKANVLYKQTLGKDSTAEEVLALLKKWGG